MSAIHGIKSYNDNHRKERKDDNATFLHRKYKFSGQLVPDKIRSDPIQIR